ncbi:MAG TPA: MFS transporter [Candidatus Gemmiger stercoravium]|uniref:MFS transporter n=1 Tax=uncultured Subdoligranulum sp. TaxID=512298 RepID=UPI001FA37688|nr:MFS transporter [uncultured Subdoligranulum sp.]HJC55508.1 MFS transporter [Candidatus Gemmiger stercoravium]
MLSLRKLFFDPEPPTEEQLARGRRCLIAEGAAAGVLYSIGTGNFLTGYLGQMGASVSFCALMAMIPQAGCVLQFFSPLLFERLHHRKLAIWALCVVFRFSLSLTFLLPARMGPGAEATALVLYTLAFLAAGAVTPGLQHMTLGLAPPDARGRFFALKDIVANCVNSGCTLVLGRLLDAQIDAGRAETGYAMVGAICLGLAALDAGLLAATRENPVDFVSRMRLADVMTPVRDKNFRPMLLYSVLGGLAGGFSAPFLVVYQMRVLGLSHTFLTTVGVVSAAAGMLGSWCWGRCADRTNWRRVIRLTALGSQTCTLGWALVSPGLAPLAAPVLLVVTAACAGGAANASANLQYVCSPPSGKTAYIGVTAALASLGACGSAAVATALQPLLEAALGPASIRVMFLLAAAGGLTNLFLNGRNLPRVR